MLQSEQWRMFSSESSCWAFPGCLVDQLILKRWANQLEICVLVLRQLPAHNFYYLVGYSETLLSHFYKCPVRLHLQSVPSKVVYKYI